MTFQHIDCQRLLTEVSIHAQKRRFKGRNAYPPEVRENGREYGPAGRKECGAKQTQPAYCKLFYSLCNNWHYNATSDS